MDFLRSQLRLSLVVDLDLARKAEFGPRWDELARAGVSSLFLKVGEQVLTPAELESLGSLTDIWRARGGYVFAIDDPILSLQLGCHGVFVRSQRHSLARLREVLGTDRFLGLEITSVDSLDRLHQAGPHCVDFVGVGPILQYGDKRVVPLGHAVARRITQGLSPLPTFWMGGIRAEDVETFGPGFADGVAVTRPLLAERVETRDASAEVLGQVGLLHRGLGKVLGPSPWSAPQPPADPNFHFSRLSTEELQSNAVPLDLNPPARSSG